MPEIDPISRALECRQREPLSLLVHERAAPSDFDGARCLRLEFSSRGDRVPAQLLLPSGGGKHPLTWLQHGLGDSKHADYIGLGARWLREGYAIFTIDFPLHGERASSKLSERLATSADLNHSGSQDAVGKLLWNEFMLQAVHDLMRGTDALETLDEVDDKRLVYGGFSLGGIVGAIYCAHDPRIRAAALALSGGGNAKSHFDPSSHVARIAPRPVLFLNAKSDETIPASASEKLHARATEPKTVRWFDGQHKTLPGEAIKTMWQFLRSNLE